MILIGENIHILSKKVSEAIKDRNASVIQDLAKRQAEAGVDYIDLNIGPVKKNPETMEWIVKVVQEVVDLPLSLDTMNPIAMEAGLSICKLRPIINSASCKEESKEKMLPLAKKYNCDVILSVINDKGIPPDANSRAETIMEGIAYANELGIKNEDIWVDPIMMPILFDQPQVVEYLEFIKMLPDIAPGCKSTVGLSNLSNGVEVELRPILNKIFLVMINRYGQYSAIVDSFDKELIKLMRGELKETTDFVYKVMDGEITDFSNLSKRETDIAKTVRVLMGKVLFSKSWLEE